MLYFLRPLARRLPERPEPIISTLKGIFRDGYIGTRGIVVCGVCLVFAWYRQPVSGGRHCTVEQVRYSGSLWLCR